MSLADLCGGKVSQKRFHSSILAVLNPYQTEATEFATMSALKNIILRKKYRVSDHIVSWTKFEVCLFAYF